MKCYIDIETSANKRLLNIFTDNIKAPKSYTDPDKIKEYIEKKQQTAISSMMVDTDYAEIKMIAYKEDDKDAVILTLRGLSAVLEEHRLKGTAITFYTFNGRSFDFPIIIKQGLVNKLDLPYEQLKEATNRYSKNHVDMMEVIGEYGRYKSLDKYMQIYLGVKKEPIDFLNCTDEELEKHAKSDVEELSNLVKVFEPVI